MASEGVWDTGIFLPTAGLSTVAVCMSFLDDVVFITLRTLFHDGLHCMSLALGLCSTAFAVESNIFAAFILELLNVGA